MKRTITLVLTCVAVGVEAEAYTAGTSYFGRSRYIEYMAGNLPVVLSAPHGGYLTPSEIPNRTSTACGGTTDFVTGGDYMTKELTLAMRTAFFNATGRYPHVVINHLARVKMDANRDERMAACGDPEAQTAWREYHGFIDAAKATIIAQYGTGFYGDIHGHGHSIQRIEIGAFTTADQLRLSDAALDATSTYEDLNSLRAMSKRTPWSYSEFLRGPTSLGSRLSDLQYRSIPSVNDPYPRVGEPYHSGVIYSQARHGCAVERLVCSVQLEHHRTGLRDSATNRARYAAAFVIAVRQFLSDHAGVTF